jgi:sugar transferase (PEP-CTERM/EpsH1 system associated)
VNILFLCQRVPYPPDRGDRITTWHFLRHMLQQGHSVRVGCFVEEDRDEEAVAFLRRQGAIVAAPRLHRGRQKLLSLRGLLLGEALTLPFFRNRALHKAVRDWRREAPPDLVYVYSSSMAQYVLGQKGCPKVMHFAELDSDKWLQFAQRGSWLHRWVYGREASKLLQFEDATARDFDLSLVVSDVEQRLFMQRIPGVTPEVLPNGVDVDGFCSAGDAAREPHTLIFTGVMDYEPNVDGVLWFADECWPRIRERHPDARWRIVGSRPTAAVLALAQRPGIEVTGRVPETAPWFDRSSVAIAPLRLARGVQNKVLEALSMSLPVVSSQQAAQGLGDDPPAGLHVAATPAAMVEAVLALFADPALARQQGTEAAAWVRERFRWERMCARLDGMLAGLVAR